METPQQYRTGWCPINLQQYSMSCAAHSRVCLFRMTLVTAEGCGIGECSRVYQVPTASPVVRCCVTPTSLTMVSREVNPQQEWLRMFSMSATWFNLSVETCAWQRCYE